MTIVTPKFTVEDYHKIVDTGVLDRRRIELIDGELIEMSPEKPIHSGVNNRSNKYLYNKFQDIADVRSSHPITLSTSEPEPDLVICKIDNNEYLYSHPVPEDIYAVIEISNTTINFDLTDKKRIYAIDRIPEYWVIDLNNREINIFTDPVRGEYRSHRKIKEGEIAFTHFPNIKLEVIKFFP